MNWLWVFIGGGLGSLSRYALSVILIPAPWGVLAVNVVGSMAAGYLLGFNSNSDYVRMGVGVGFLGGFTTFSAFSAEFFRLYLLGESLPAMVFAGTNVLLSLIACYFGLKIA